MSTRKPRSPAPTPLGLPRLRSSVLLFVGVSLILGGCGRRPPPLPPPPDRGPVPTEAPAPGRPETAAPAPRLDLWVEPTSIAAGESALLTWESRDASRVSIEPAIGEVDPSGRIRFFPDTTTTYTVMAEGEGGRVDRSVTVEVRGGRAARDDISEEDLRGMSPEQQFETFVRPVFFPFDSSELTEEAKQTIEGNVHWLQRPENRHLRFVLEGHTDERGSEEYNLALGDRRAQVVRDYLVNRGIDAARVLTVSLGEERPFDSSQTEQAYALNRRAHFVLLRER
jgi:peptidoglycan-associated lipoprotein